MLNRLNIFSNPHLDNRCPGVLECVSVLREKITNAELTCVIIETRGLWCYVSGTDEELSFVGSSLLVKDSSGDIVEDLYDRERQRFLVGLLPIVRGWSTQEGNPKITEEYVITLNNEGIPDWSPPILPPPFDLFKDVVIRGYQLDAITAGISGRCGIIKVPTSGGKTLLMGAIARLIDLPTLILVPTAPLVRQVIRALEDLGITGIGQAGDGEFDPGKITVADVRYLKRLLIRGNKTARKLCDAVKVVLVDECQGVGNDTTSTIIHATKATWRVGFSGTPFQKPENPTFRDLLLIGMLGPVLYEIPAQELQRDGFIATPQIYFVTVHTPNLHHYHVDSNWPRPRKSKIFMKVIDEGIVNHTARNQLAMDATWIFVRRWNLSTLILVNRIEHGKVLLSGLASRKISAVFVAGDKMVYKQDDLSIETCADVIINHESQTVASFARGEYEVLIGSPVFGVGYNLPGDMVQAMIPLCAGKGSQPVIQRLGRSLRPKDHGNSVIILEFQDDHHFYLRNHSNARRRAYAGEGYKVLGNNEFIRDILHGTTPPVALATENDIW